ncbi:MAG TPA: sulfocyanin-like copper-binding protein [Sulfolobales archaeon]|nr:sulfocyanin-like copper-binding protein [Sulfolobales archaeon]
MKLGKAVSTTTAIIAIVVIVLAVAIIYLYYQQTVSRPAPTTSPTTTPSPTPIGNKLPYDASSKTVYVTLDTKTTNYDFNGSTRGRLIIYIPAGWNLEIRYVNNDPSGLPHSVGIIANNTPTPKNTDPTKDGSLVTWAPDGARGVSGFKEGIGSGETTMIKASSIQKGVYWIACGIPGHAISGMWIVLVSSDSVTEPYFVTA